MQNLDSKMHPFLLNNLLGPKTTHSQGKEGGWDRKSCAKCHGHLTATKADDQSVDDVRTDPQTPKPWAIHICLMSPKNLAHMLPGTGW